MASNTAFLLVDRTGEARSLGEAGVEFTPRWRAIRSIVAALPGVADMMTPINHSDDRGIHAMKSARIDAFTQEPSDIRVEDVPVPDPGPGQVRVRMRLSPVNPSDLNFVRGTYHHALERIIWNRDRPGGETRVFFDPARGNPCPVPPYSLGGEGVGIVEASGGGFLANRLRGKRVALVSGPPQGTWQEYTVVDAKRAVTLPDAIPDEQAAMFFVNPLTAYAMVRDVLDVPRGGWLLVTAAGSSLGKSVVRLGQRDGFRTICVVRSGANTAELTALGADAVIETSRQDLVGEVARITGGRGVGYALDCVGGPLTGEVVRCLGFGGRLLVYGTLDDSPIAIPSRDLMMPGAEISGFLLPNWVSRQSPLKLLGVLRDVKRLMVDGIFHAEVAETYPLAAAADAVAAAIKPGRTGKVMIRITGDSPR
jgi:NADPH:quinone reductase-like Zn-dependent oxidoreductase